MTGAAYALGLLACGFVALVATIGAISPKALRRLPHDPRAARVETGRGGYLTRISTNRH